MKKLKLIFTFLLFLGIIQGYAGVNEVPAEIINALNKGDAAVIATYLNDNVELSIENKNDIFSKQQANSIITDFFRKNTVSGFSLIHKGKKESASFIIGTLTTSKGAFRVYILTRTNNTNKEVIQQFRIEPSNE